MNPGFIYYNNTDQEEMALFKGSYLVRTIKLMVGVLLYAILFQILYNLIRYDVIFLEDGGVRDFVISIVKNYFPMLVIFGINIYTIMHLWGNSIVTKYFPLKIVADVCVCLCGTVAVDYLVIWIYGSVHWIGTMLNSILTLLLVEVVYYVKESRNAVLRAETAKREVLQYQYNTLKSQINPHFLFNSLNILYSLISIDTEKSKKFVISLSQMYRYIMSHQNIRSTSLKDELEFLNSYVSILEMRYHNKFGIVIENCDDVEVEKESVVPFTLQLLMENVTKHNIISTRHPMSITLSLYRKCLTVSNPIRRKEAESVSGIGLRYIAEQYKLRDKDFEVEDDGAVFVAKVPYL